MVKKKPNRGLDWGETDLAALMQIVEDLQAEVDALRGELSEPVPSGSVNIGTRLDDLSKRVDENELLLKRLVHHYTRYNCAI